MLNAYVYRVFLKTFKPKKNSRGTADLSKSAKSRSFLKSGKFSQADISTGNLENQILKEEYKGNKGWFDWSSRTKRSRRY